LQRASQRTVGGAGAFLLRSHSRLLTVKPGHVRAGRHVGSVIRVIDSLTPEALAALTAFVDGRIEERLLKRDTVPRTPDLMTVKEAADYLRTSEGAIYKRIQRKQIPFARPDGSGILISREDIDHILDRSARRSYDLSRRQTRPREADTSGAVATGGKS
jgi:excisionase family DNA binding protein